MRIYISGKITNDPMYVTKFAVAELMLQKEGYDTLNPARAMSNFPTYTPYSTYMACSFRLLDMCDTIYLLKDWEESCGARMEYEYAKATGKNILYEERIKNAES